jgi:glutamate carboxypeptidase
LSPMSRRWLSQSKAEAPALLADLEALVRMESPSDDADRVRQVAAWIRERLRGAGLTPELRPCPPRGSALLASVGSPEGGTLLLGHLDTVWPVGTIAERPWRVDGGRAYGPGVFDMKAGIAVALAVLAAAARESPRPSVSLLLVPDEEVGSAASRELTVSLARRQRRVLVLEPSQDGAAKTARKGCGTFHVRFSGRAAHAGLEPERGASALAEMARFVMFLDREADPSKGTTLTATVARAGSATNVVPEAAELSVDGRAWSREEAERATAAIHGYTPADAGVSVSVEGGFDRPPLEPSAASTALYETARRLAADVGFVLGAARVGGASDGNFTAAAGVPTLDGLGPRGDGAHARDEHVVLDDLPLRAALISGLVSDA